MTDARSSAFLLISTTRSAYELSETLRREAIVVWDTPVYGPHQVVAYAETEGPAQLARLVERLRQVDGVVSLDARICKFIPEDLELGPFAISGPEVAVLLVNVDHGVEKERVVTCNLRALAGVRLARAMWGPADVIAVVEASDHEAMRNLICDDVKQMKGVQSNTTLYAYPSLPDESAELAEVRSVQGVVRTRETRRWTFRNALARGREILREDGVAALWYGILGQTVYRRLTLMELVLDPLPPVVDSTLPLGVGFLTSREVSDYLELRPDADEQEVIARLARGERCFVARHNGLLVSARWIASGEAEIEYLGRRLPFAPDEVFLSDTFTSPSFRGNAISAAAGTRLAHVLAGEGIRRIIGAILPENRRAARAFDKAGARPFGKIGYVAIGPLRRDFIRVSREM
jgi:hypothetical protein